MRVCFCILNILLDTLNTRGENYIRDSQVQRKSSEVSLSEIVMSKCHTLYHFVGSESYSNILRNTSSRLINFVSFTPRTFLPSSLLEKTPCTSKTCGGGKKRKRPNFNNT